MHKSVWIFFLLTIYSLLLAEGREILIKDISKHIKRYQGKELTLLLKLKNYNTIFNKITFYDRKNYDIEFDISAKEDQKKFKQELKNLHEGMDYQVTFVIKGVSALGLIIAKLKAFSPRIYKIIP